MTAAKRFFRVSDKTRTGPKQVQQSRDKLKHREVPVPVLSGALSLNFLHSENRAAMQTTNRRISDQPAHAGNHLFATFFALTKLVVTLALFLPCGLSTAMAEDKPAERPVEADRQPKANERGFRFSIGGPVIGRASKQIHTSMKDGVRTVTVTDGTEKIEFTDTAGKNIVVKQSKTVDGKSETTEVKAADLAALKVKSKDAANLYEKYATVPGAQVIEGGKFQFQLGVNRRQVAPEPGFTDEGIEPKPVERKIRFQMHDRIFEIYDSVGPSIRMKITKVVDQKEQSEEFRAESAAEFKAAHPELFRIYEKYTGNSLE